jgi:tRNA(Ile)-lysidine synthase
MQRLRSESRMVDTMYTAIIESVSTQTDGYLIVDKTRLPGEFELVLRLLDRLSAPYGFTYEQCRQMLLLRERTTLSGTAGWVEVTPDRLTFGSGPLTSEKTAPITVSSLPLTLRDGDLLYTIEETDRPPVLNVPGTLFLSPAPLPFTVRHRRGGDRMQPLGMGGQTRSLKKIYNDLKLSEEAKRRTLLLCSSDGAIMAIMGRRISEAYCVENSDTRVLSITVKKINPGQS